MAIKEYNKKYYRKKKHIILYNKRAREDTECVLIVEKYEDKAKVKAIKYNRFDITINPKRKFETNPEFSQ
jgi:hypothetical protein